jgi:L-ascorbate metabolism protein UlaG (beta-lactamase superfamily)
MFRKSKAKEIEQFSTLPLAKKELAVFYLGKSGFLARTTNSTVIIDPAGFLKKDEVTNLKAVNLLLFTHNHGDHFNSGATQTVFKEKAAPILAEPKVIKKLSGKIPADKLTSAESGKTYTFGGITVTAIQGIHLGPIMLYQIKTDDLVIFHGGDSGYVTLNAYPSDIAFLPTGRPSASPEKAYKMASDLKPSWAVPIHGSAKSKLQFESKIKAGMPQTHVLILEPYTSATITVGGNRAL